MNINEMIKMISGRYGDPIIKDNGNKILMSPFKFIIENDEFVIYENVERRGLTERIRTTDEAKACLFLIELLEDK